MLEFAYNRLFPKERRNTVSTFSDDTLSESPSNPLDEKATSNEHTTVEQTGPAATNTKVC